MSNAEERSRKQKAGMNCPQCGAFIETSIFELLTSGACRAHHATYVFRLTGLDQNQHSMRCVKYGKLNKI